MSFPISLAVLLGLSVAYAQPFQPLFNGRNLDQFIIDTPGLWRVENGDIVGVSPGLSYNDFLRTRKHYSNFVLRLKFQMMDSSGRANSGVQFRSRPLEGSHEVIGYQADIGQQYWGCLYDESRRRKVLAQPSPGQLDGLDKAGWNQYVITARGGRIKLELNGRTTVDYAEPDPSIEPSGFIAFQLHSGPAFSIRFRDIEIQELSSAASWVERSNQHARLLLDITARFSPEGAGALGVDGLDELVSDPSDQAASRRRAAYSSALAELESRAAREYDPAVRQDLEIMIQAARRTIGSLDLSHKLRLPYLWMPRTVFQGLRALLDDQVPPHRCKAALVRLRRYAGMEPGFTPIMVSARDRMRAALANPSLTGPFRSQVEQDLAQSAGFLDGIGQLFSNYNIDGYQDALATLRRQSLDFSDFVRREILPRSRTGFRLPPQLYQSDLENYGVDIPPEQLILVARASFTEIQSEMNSVAARLARQRGWSFKDYRLVLRELKKEQILGDATLPHYRRRLAQIEEIVRRENLVTLPARDARIRISSAAETLANPAPNMRPPRLVANNGEMGEFVLPLRIPDASGKSLEYDDFTYDAASWSLASHELRPGHEMQFSKMMERGVSTARAVFAFNSANVEGWGLYAESIMLPYMPLEGQLASLAFRLMRAARAFLDPELQLGRISVDQATRILIDDVLCSQAMAKQETDRYTFRMPGQATSYFFGYLKLSQLRAEVEKALGPKFSPWRFHDFILDQGLLPPALLRKAVLGEFVP